jgi:hypothetical protein
MEDLFMRTALLLVVFIASSAMAADIPSNVCPTKYDIDRDEVKLCFTSDGLLTASIPRDIDDNDIFRLSFLGSKSDVDKVLVEIDGTLSTGDSVDVVGAGSLPKNQTQTFSTEAGDVFELGTFGPYASPSATVKFYIVDGTTKNLIRQYAIRVNKTYVAAYRLAAVRSKTRLNDFSLAPTPDGHKAILNTAGGTGDVRYLLAIEPYIWPALRSHSWRGRDVAKPPKPIERVNPIFAVGLKNPSDEWFAGVSIEFARGFTAVWGIHRIRVNTLGGGYKEGDQFTGDAKDIPLVKKWSKRETLVGLSLDLRIATQMLSSLFK